jgi:hypothetical protein
MAALLRTTTPTDLSTVWAAQVTTIVSTASEMFLQHTEVRTEGSSTYTVIVQEPPQFDGSWAPLTTQFIPPDSCTDRYYTVLATPKTPIITSGLLEPGFGNCQANGANNTFSPGMCPGNLQTATRSFNGTLFTEICCQRQAQRLLCIQRQNADLDHLVGFHGIREAARHS